MKRTVQSSSLPAINSMKHSERVGSYCAESLRLSTSLANFFKKREEMEMDHQKAIRTHSISNHTEELCCDFLKQSAKIIPRFTAEGGSDSEWAREGKAPIPTKMLLDTSLWKKIAEHVVDSVKTSKEVQTYSYEYIQRSMIPLLEEIEGWEKATKAV